MESTNVRMARLEEKFDNIAKDIQGIKKLLEGNGKPGVIGRLEEVEKKLAEYDGGKKMLIAIFGSSLFTGILVFILQKFL